MARPDPQNGQPITAPSIEPAVLVMRSSNDVVRLGVNNWAHLTAPLSKNPLSTPRTVAPRKPDPHVIRHAASKNPHGMKSNMLLIKSTLDAVGQGCSQIRRRLA